jgi:ABC-type bacteriocin/lantibiotic exporter with double-glycine peptidase domain
MHTPLTTTHAVSRFIRFLLPYWQQELVVLICLLFTTIGSLAPPYIVKIIIDDVLPAKQFSLLLPAIAILLAITLINLVLSYLSDYLYAWVSNHLVRDIRVGLFHHLMHLPLSFHNRQNTGDLIFRLDSDVGIIQSVLTSSLLRLLHSILTLAGLVILLCWLNTTLFLLCIVVVPFFMVNLIFFQPKIKRIVESMQQQGSDIFSYVIERFNNVQLVQLTNSGGHETAHLGSVLERLIASIMKNVLYSVSMGTVSFGLVAVTPVIIMGWGGYQVIQGVMTVGVLVAFLQYTARLFGPILDLNNLYMDLVRGLVSMQRVLEFMHQPTQVEAHRGRKPFVYNHAIELQDLHFSFDGQPILQGVNLKLFKGKTYALAGVSGCGKTTLANLLCGIYHPDKGRILIDEVALQDIRLHELRQHIGLVSQHVQLFHDTIWENIRYGNFEQTPEQIEQVIHQVGLDGSLDLQEKIGEQGVQLSGGQKQRIALARTLLRPVQLLILDEATAALDSASEQAIYHNLQQSYPDITILLVSHRLSTMQSVDEVIYLVEGRIVEQGPPEALRKKQGSYARFFQTQQDAATYPVLQET